MINKKLPDKIQASLNDWYDRDIKPAYFWERDSTFFVVVVFPDEMQFLRLWDSPYKKQVLVSVDSKSNLEDVIILEDDDYGYADQKNFD